MLAWVHQSLASERELLVALFGDQQSIGGGADGKAAPADMPSTPELLDRIFESICKPLKVPQYSGGWTLEARSAMNLGSECSQALRHEMAMCSLLESSQNRVLPCRSH